VSSIAQPIGFADMAERVKPSVISVAYKKFVEYSGDGDPKPVS